MSFKKNDSVKFDGDLDMAPLEKTVVAHVDEAKHQIIIEHPNGHLGAEFTNLPLEPRKTYTYVKPQSIHLLGRADTIETIVAEPIIEVNGESQTRALSDVFKALKEARPADEHKFFDDVIAKAEKIESDAAKKLAKQQLENNATQQKAVQDEAIRADVAKSEQLDAETKQRMIDQEKEVQTLIEATDYLEKYGVIFFNPQTRIYFLKGTPLNIFINEATDRKRAIANYMQNTPDDLEIVKQEAARLFALEQAGKLAPPTPKADTEGVDFKAKVKAENEKVLADREAAAKAESGSEKETADAPEGNTPKEAKPAKADKGGAPADAPKKLTAEDRADYVEKLISLDGIGKAAADKIVSQYPTPALLMAGIKDKTAKFTDKVSESLKKAVKTKWFKDRA